MAYVVLTLRTWKSLASLHRSQNLGSNRCSTVSLLNIVTTLHMICWKKYTEIDGGEVSSVYIHQHAKPLQISIWIPTFLYKRHESITENWFSLNLANIVLTVLAIGDTVQLTEETKTTFLWFRKSGQDLYNQKKLHLYLSVMKSLIRSSWNMKLSKAKKTWGLIDLTFPSEYLKRIEYQWSQ